MEMVLITKKELASVISEAATKAAELAVRKMPKNRPEHYRKIDAAKELNISRPTLDKLIKAGSVRMNEFGMIPASEIDRVISARSTS